MTREEIIARAVFHSLPEEHSFGLELDDVQIVVTKTLEVIELLLDREL